MASSRHLFASVLAETKDKALALAILHSAQDVSMERLLRACLELDPSERDAVSQYIEATHTSNAKSNVSYLRTSSG